MCFLLKSRDVVRTPKGVTGSVHVSMEPVSYFSQYAVNLSVDRPTKCLKVMFVTTVSKHGDNETKTHAHEFDSISRKWAKGKKPSNFIMWYSSWFMFI